MWGYPSRKVLDYMTTQAKRNQEQSHKCGKFEKLTALIDQEDRRTRRAWEAWDLLNRLVNEVYGIDIGDALVLWEQQNGDQKTIVEE